MGWFEEQLKLRKENDEKQVTEALNELDSVTHKRKKKIGNHDEMIIGRILSYFHKEIPSVICEGAVEADTDELAHYLKTYGISIRKAKLCRGFERYATGPILATFVKNERRVLLEPRRLFGYKYYDEELKRYVKITSKNEVDFKESAFCFYEKFPDKSLTIRDLIYFIFRQISAAEYLVYIALLLLITLLGAGSTAITKKLMGDVVRWGQDAILNSFVIFVFSYTVSKGLFLMYNKLFLKRICTKQENSVNAAVIERVLSFPTSFFKQYSVGELNERIRNVQNLCKTLFMNLGVTGLSILFSSVLVFQIGIIVPALFAPTLIIMLISLVFNIVSIMVQIHVSRKQLKAASVTNGTTYAIISGIQKIKLTGAENRFFAQWAKKYAKEAEYAYNPPLVLKLNSAISAAISAFGAIAIYYVSVNYNVSKAEYFAFYAAFGMISAVVAQLSGAVSAIASIQPVIEMAEPILSQQPELCGGKKIVKELKGRIKVNNLCFRYNQSQPYIIKDFSLNIEPGECVAIVGTTGCGKSTLLKLLLGFEQPESGTIFYDMDEIHNLDLRSLRRRIGTILQNEQLLVGDVYSNITFTAPDLSEEEVWEVARKAQIADDIEAMPMKLKTVISEGQGGLSGGQRQRLLIARAIATKPSILILDEATSALDNVTQKRIMEVIDAIDCTKIVIAHRLSTVKNCNRIIVLDKGSIIEDGTYKELMERNGFFTELVKRQQTEYGEKD